jgi:cation diffusion facilitator CzcD-associated flavoprotein CzcO
MSREHLDQKFTGYVVEGAYKMGNHWITGRYDMLNYNSGDKWYTAFNPYKNTTAGVPTGNDLSPKYTEITVGYNYLFDYTKQVRSKLKLDYALRSNNFLLPPASQTGQQAVNSLVASLSASF